MIASGRREQSPASFTPGEDVQGGFFQTNKPLSFFTLGYRSLESAPTAPPQVGSEIELVTNSAKQSLLEAPHRVSDRSRSNKPAPTGAAWTQFAPGHHPRLHLSVHLSFPSRTLSAPPGSGA